jgi:hypothetical protein
MRKSPSAISLHASVCSYVTPFHSSHLEITVPANCFQTAGANAIADPKFSSASKVRPASASFAARYSCLLDAFIAHGIRALQKTLYNDVHNN